MKYSIALVLVLVLVVMAGCTQASGTAQKTEEMAPDETHEPAPESESEPETPQEPEPQADPPPPESPPAPQPKTPDILISLQDNSTPGVQISTAYAQSVTARSTTEGTDFVTRITFDGTEDITAPEGFPYPPVQGKLVLGDGFDDGYCVVRAEDSNGDQTRHYIVAPNFNNDVRTVAPVRHDDAVDTDRKVAVTLEDCEFYNLDDFGISYAIDQSAKTVTTNIETAGAVTGTVTTYTVSLSATASTMVEGEAPPVALASDVALPNHRTAYPNLLCNDPLLAQLLATDSESGRSYMLGPFDGTSGSTAFAQPSDRTTIPDTETASTDRNVRVELVQIQPVSCAQSPTDPTQRWNPPTATYEIAVAASSVTINVTDQP